MAIAAALPAQEPGGPVARFSFDYRNDLDEISGHKPRLVNINYTEDRFGNANSAVYLYGNENSYLNLGNYKALKPRAGSISLWVSIASRVWSGSGITANPIILTKCHGLNDFFESYSLFFAMESNKIVTNCSRDSLKQVVIPQNKFCSMVKWHHLVLTFNDAMIALYFDGDLQGMQVKGFETRYLAGDSVMVGNMANKKNNRFFMGSVDDIEFYDRVLDGREVKALYTAPGPAKKVALLDWALAMLALVLTMFLVYSLAKYRLGKVQQKERERLGLINKLLETELRANRVLMNPHFVFNSLYSIQSFILNHNVEQANNYLVKFSRLLRKTLENNTSEIVSLEAEMDLLDRFLDIENIKFEDTIRYTIKTVDDFSTAAIYIPIMMVQPFVENAVLHGLQNKQGEKQLSVTFALQGSKYLECVVEDNGVGRKVKSEPETKKSLATTFIRTRLDLLNRLYALHCSLVIIDKPNGQGTIVKILLPVSEKKP